MTTRAAAALLLALACTAAGHARAADLSAYFGTYVGVATVESDAGEDEQRDIDMVISPYKSGGFQIEWIAVSLVDGRRDVPGVKRQKNAVAFEPGKEDCCFVEAEEYDPFRETEALQPMLGEPVRWAVLDDAGLHVYSFAVLEDGGYELQTYNRRLTDAGIDLLYELIDDGVVKRRVTGRTVRTGGKE